MKNKSITLSSFLIALLYLLIISCKKETIQPDLSFSSCVYNISSNPEDFYGKSYIDSLQANLERYPNTLLGRNSYEQAINLTNNSFPLNWDTITPVNDAEIAFLINLKTIFRNAHSKSELFDNIANWESDVLKSSVSNERINRLLRIGSYFKHYTKYMFEVIDYQMSYHLTEEELTENYAPNGFAQWEQDLMDCIGDRMEDIFGDDNYVDDIEFIISAPLSFGWHVAWCVWEITGITITRDDLDISADMIEMDNIMSNCYP